MKEQMGKRYNTSFIKVEFAFGSDWAAAPYDPLRGPCQKKKEPGCIRRISHERAEK